MRGSTCSSNGKESAYDAEDQGSIPGLGSSSGEGNGNLLQYSCLENSMDREAWRAAVMGSQRVGHDWVANTLTDESHYCLCWIFSICPPRTTLRTAPLSLCPGRLVCMGCIKAPRLSSFLSSLAKRKYCQKLEGGTSQWSRLWASSAGAKVQFLVGKLRSHILHSTVKIY